MQFKVWFLLYFYKLLVKIIPFWIKNIFYVKFGSKSCTFCCYFSRLKSHAKEAVLMPNYMSRGSCTFFPTMTTAPLSALTVDFSVFRLSPREILVSFGAVPNSRFFPRSRVGLRVWGVWEQKRMTFRPQDWASIKCILYT